MSSSASYGSTAPSTPSSNPSPIGFAALAGPLLFAHRGARLELPENTLPAFERARELGADVLELDVHATRDGHAVVCHDPDLSRTAGLPRRIRDLSLAELREIEVRRPEEPGLRAKVPTLLELLEQLPSAVLNVDVKEARALDPTLEVIRRV
ncbi:MAG TPA: glycerophosphodiester phosphodiesterase family protein, partial [Polyangiaceae bacterium]|nr:glycerophosphodiester phosphodiesterase family protein [Polyangiaceae bacterium]